jgi:hypothetical protein
VRLDLDHLGAQIGEDQGRERADPGLGEVEYAQPLQRRRIGCPVRDRAGLGAPAQLRQGGPAWAPRRWRRGRGNGLLGARGDPGELQLSKLWMPHGHEVAASFELLAGEQVLRGVDPAADDASGFESEKKLVHGLAARVAPEEGLGLGDDLVVAALVEVGRPVVGRDAENLAQHAFLARIGNEHRDPAVRTRKDAHAGLRAALAHLVAAHVLDAQEGRHRGQGLDAVDLHQVAASMALASVQGRERADEGVDANDELDQMRRRGERRHVARSVERQVAREGLDRQGVALVGGVRSPSAKGRYGDGDELRAPRAQIGKRQAKRRHPFGARDDHDIAKLGGRGRLREREGPLARRDILPGERKAVTVARLGHRPKPAHRRAAFGLDHDHVGAPKRELAGAIGGGKVPAELQHAQAGERALLCSRHP